MTDKEIVNADGSRNWQANILLDNLKRLEQENAELKALVSQRDASVTAQTGIILELKAENATLKANSNAVQTYITQNQQLKTHLSGLEKKNAELKAELQNFKDMAKKGLDEFKDVGGCWGCGLQLQLNQDMEDIKQLKAENEKLKEATDGLLNIQYTLADSCKKYSETLQEIKELAEVGQDKYHNGLILAKPILDLINKAEEE